MTEPLDTGGLQTGTLPLFGALASSWTENQYLLNGFDITDPYTPGRPLIDLNLNAFDRIDFFAAAKPVSFAGSGMNVDAISSAPSNDLHGDVRAFFSNQSLQSNNIDAQMRAQNFPGNDHLNHMLGTAFDVTGKIPSLNWRLFASFSSQQLNKSIGGISSPIDGAQYSALVAVTPFSDDRSQLHVLYAGEHLTDSHENASQFTLPSATTAADNNTHVIQALWKHRNGRNDLFQLGFGLIHAGPTSSLQNQITAPSTLDLPQRLLSGSAPFSQSGSRLRYEFDGKFHTDFMMHGSHSVELGAHYDHSTMDNRWDNFGGLQQILVDGIGTEVIRWNTPALADSHIQDVAIYAADSWKVSNWLSIPIGLRFENSTGSASNSAASIRWTSLQPHIGILLSTSPKGPQLIGTWSRYGHLLQGRYLDFGNPNALGGEVFRWEDVNHDEQVQADETGPLISRFGGPYTEIDPGLKQPFTNEITAGIEQDLGSGLSAGVRFFRRDDRNLIGLINTGVPLSAYSAVSIVDPGNDGIPDTADDSLITLYNRDPAFLGKDSFLLSNPQSRNSTVKGFEIAIRKNFAPNWQTALYFTVTKSAGATNPGNFVFQNDVGVIGTLGADPNTLLLANSTTFFDRNYVAKFSATYQAPSHFRLGIVARYYDGLPFGRLLFVNGFQQGPFFVRVTPRDNFPEGFRTEFNATLDLRVAREFFVGKNRLAVYLNVFNLLNMNNRTFENDLTGSTFRFPLSVQDPCMAALGFEWKF